MLQTDAEFDRYDAEYKALVEESIGFSGISHDYVTEVKADLIIEAAHERWGSLTERKILDIGCGVGLTDALLVDKPWKVYGTDVSENSIERARKKNPGVDYQAGSEDKLPYDDQTFDLCFTICVMHHVPPQGWDNFLLEMRRVLKPGGLAIILEHNPFNPLTRLAVNRCPFDENAVLLSRKTLLAHLAQADLKHHQSKYFLFTPWRSLRFVEKFLTAVPMGAQYMVAATR